MSDRLLDYRTAAEYLGVRPKTLRKWVSGRRIPFVKVGRLVRFRPVDVERWVEVRVRETTASTRNGQAT